MVTRLLLNGCDVTVFNRTASKVQPLTSIGAKRAQSIAELASKDIVFVTVSSSDDLLAVLFGEGGLLRQGDVPKYVVDCSTVSEESSAKARERAQARSVAFLAAPVSGNPSAVRAGRATFAVSGQRAAFDEVRPCLELLGSGVTFVGEGEIARLVKLCHNLFLGVVIQGLIEVTILAEKAGVRRQDFLAFMNDSVLGSTFTRYKTPALVNLDYAPSFTTRLLKKDFDLGATTAGALGVPVPLSTLVRDLLDTAVGEIGEVDFAALIESAARAAGLTLRSENASVSDGLSP
jgi:3-hydroxyisobutyrate dehydrogenase-like beta-hydroxyacid dehydrogenase